MGQTCRRLEQKQTPIRSRREKTATAALIDQVIVILARLETEERKAESILTSRLAVATAAVAAGFRKDRYDLVRKMNRMRIFKSLNYHAQPCFESCFRTRQQVGLSILQG